MKDPMQDQINQLIAEHDAADLTTSCVRGRNDDLLDQYGACRLINGHAFRMILATWIVVAALLIVPATVSALFQSGTSEKINLTLVLPCFFSLTLGMPLRMLFEHLYRRREYRFISRDICLECGISRTEYSDRCWSCGDLFVRQDKRRRERRHQAATGSQSIEREKRLESCRVAGVLLFVFNVGCLAIACEAFVGHQSVSNEVNIILLLLVFQILLTGVFSERRVEQKFEAC